MCGSVNECVCVCASFQTAVMYASQSWHCAYTALISLAEVHKEHKKLTGTLKWKTV